MPAKPARLLRFLFADKGLKLLSLLVAVVAWYWIREIISHEKKIEGVPVTFAVEPGWAVLDQAEPTVSITFRGPEEAVWALGRDNVQVVVDLTGDLALGSRFVPIQTRHVRAARGVRVQSIEPQRIYLTLDREDRAEVAVRANVLSASLPEGYEIEGVMCRPALTKVHGPFQRVSRLTEVRTAPVGLEGRLQSFRLRVPLQSPGNGWAARLDPDHVEVEVTIVERAASRTLADVPVRALLGGGRRPVRMVLFPETVHLVLTGRSQVLETLSADEVVAYVDAQGLQAGATYRLPVRVHAPMGVAVRETEPATAEVTIEEP